MATHVLKTDQEVFNAVRFNQKTHEIRYNDRDYQVGDQLVLKCTRYTGAEMREGKPLEYIGDAIEKVVTHVLTGYGLQPGWCILSMQDIDDGPEYTLADPDLNALLNTAVDLSKGRGNMDLGMYFMDVLAKVEGRLKNPA